MFTVIDQFDIQKEMECLIVGLFERNEKLQGIVK